MIMFTTVKNRQRLWCGIRKTKIDLRSIYFVYFDGTCYEEREVYFLDETEKIVNNQNFDKTLSTVIYIHGYVESLESDSTKTVIESYLIRNDHNIIVLDWSNLADGNYVVDAAVNVKKVGKYLGDILIEIIRHGLDIQKLHIVGHSMGAHIAGMAGKYLKKNSEMKLPRISALDPAFHPFYPSVIRHLKENDAKFVDVIHTDAWVYGAPIRTGTVDFWPNGGKMTQPGCPKRKFDHSDDDLAGHWRSWQYWGESVSSKQITFHAIKCKSWRKFRQRQFKSTVVAFMGINCPNNVRGCYYLQTNEKSPFSRDEGGIYYQPPNANVMKTEL